MTVPWWLGVATGCFFILLGTDIGMSSLNGGHFGDLIIGLIVMTLGTGIVHTGLSERERVKHDRSRS